MRRAFWAIGSIGLLAGCLGTAPDPGDLTSAVVTGQVVRPDGVTPVGGPQVTAQLLSAINGGSATLIATLTTLASDEGRFTLLFRTYEPVQTGSVIVSVIPAPGQGLVGRDTTGIPVRIQAGEIPTDTTYVQIQLQAR